VKYVSSCIDYLVRVWLLKKFCSNYWHVSDRSDWNILLRRRVWLECWNTRKTDVRNGVTVTPPPTQKFLRHL